MGPRHSGPKVLLHSASVSLAASVKVNAGVSLQVALGFHRNFLSISELWPNLKNLKEND